MGGWGGGSLEEEKVWEGGVVTVQGLGSGTPTVRAAEAAGPTATAEGHREGDHRVHPRRAAREPDGSKGQLTVGAHRLGHRRQSGWQHPNLEARAGGGSGMGVCLPRAKPSPDLPSATHKFETNVQETLCTLPPTYPALQFPGPYPKEQATHPPWCRGGSTHPQASRASPPALGSSPCWGSSRHRCWW